MKFLAYIFLVFCFFPYVDILGIGTDTQPNAILVGTVLLFGVHNKKINTPLILLWLLFFFSLLLVFYNNLGPARFIKNSANYYSLALVTTVSYYVFKRAKIQLPFKLFLIAISIYGLVGFLQYVIDPNLFTGLLNMSRGNLLGGRGVGSLTTEPAYYGSMCLYFIIFSLLYYSPKQNMIVIPLLCLQLIFLCMSATTMGLLLTAIIVFTIIQMLRFKWKYILSAFMVLAITLPLLFQAWGDLQETRMGSLAKEVVDNPLLITQVDGSVAIRFTLAAAPFLAMRHEYLRPMGLGFYSAFLINLYEGGYYRSFIRPKILEKKFIGGGMNAVLFQLGIFGWLFPVALYMAFRRRLKDDRIKFAFILFVLMLFTQIQLMNGMIGLLIGLALYQSRYPKNQPSHVTNLTPST